MKRFAIFVLVLTIASGCLGQDGSDASDLADHPGSVSGTVTNDTGSPLAHAGVQVKGQNVGTQTNENGQYKLENLIPGTTIIEASADGHETSLRAVQVNEGAMATAHFELRPLDATPSASGASPSQ